MWSELWDELWSWITNFKKLININFEGILKKNKKYKYRWDVVIDLKSISHHIFKIPILKNQNSFLCLLCKL